MLKNWTDEHTQRFGKDTFTVQHDLNSTGLFTDEALAELLDKHPRSHLDVCTIADHDVYQAKFRTGDVRDVDGKTLIEAARAGSIWMNLREAMNMHEAYKSVLDLMYGDLSELSGTRQFKPRGGFLLHVPPPIRLTILTPRIQFYGMCMGGKECIFILKPKSSAR